MRFDKYIQPRYIFTLSNNTITSCNSTLIVKLIRLVRDGSIIYFSLYNLLTQGYVQLFCYLSILIYKEHRIVWQC